MCSNAAAYFRQDLAKEDERSRVALHPTYYVTRLKFAELAVE